MEGRKMDENIQEKSTELIDPKVFGNVKQSELVKVLKAYIPDNQPSPKGYIELIKTQIMGVDSKGKTRPTEDLVLFLYTTKRTGLDPLARQIYPVYRWDSRLGREKMVIQTGIDGFRLTAERSNKYLGQDDVIYTPDEGSKEAEELGHPIKATATVYKVNKATGEKVATVASVRWSEYAQKDRDGKLIGLWKTMPYNQLGKCAEALALRKAFPQELSGMYIDEELQQERDARKQVIDNLQAPQKVEKMSEELKPSPETPKNEPAKPNPDKLKEVLDKKKSLNEEGKETK